MTGPKPINFRFFEDLRIWAARVAGMAAFLLLLVVAPCWPQRGGLDAALDVAGLVCVAVGTYGRLWCGLYICGYKMRCLVTSGPYSIVRHPLYVASFIGALGVALSANMLTLVLAVVLLFALSYPLVIRLEDRLLKTVHGAAFEDYRKRVPSLAPKFSLHEEPPVQSVNTRLYRRAIVESFGFAGAFFLLQAIERLHEWHWLPVLFRLY